MLAGEYLNPSAELLNEVDYKIVGAVRNLMCENYAVIQYSYTLTTGEKVWEVYDKEKGKTTYLRIY